MRFESKWKNTSIVKVGKGKWVHTAEYTIWSNMRKRVGAKRNYEDVLMSEAFADYDEWLDWARSQKGFLSKDLGGKVFSMDKDLLSGGRGVVYCPNSVVFIPSQLNSIVTRSSKGGLRGVQTFHNGGRKVHTVKFNFDGKTRYHGQFDSIEEACHVAEAVWRTNAMDIALRYDLDDRVYEAISKMSY